MFGRQSEKNFHAYKQLPTRNLEIGCAPNLPCLVWSVDQGKLHCCASMLVLGHLRRGSGLKEPQDRLSELTISGHQSSLKQFGCATF